MRGVALGLILGIGAAAALSGEDPKTSPTVARETAEANAKTPAGRRYESALESSMDSWLRRALERCAKAAAKEDRISFDVLIRISGSGEAEEVLFTPETSVGKCAERDFRDAKYPSPPKPGWWVEVPVGLK